MATVYQYFETEFLHAFVAKKQMAAVGGMRTIHFDTAVHLDFDACAAYVSIYLPMNIQEHTELIIQGIIKNPSQVSILNGISTVNPPKDIPKFTRVEIINKPKTEIYLTYPGEEKLSANELPFSGRIFIYTEKELPVELKQRLSQIACARMLKLRFRGPIFAQERDKYRVPKAFI